MMTVDYSVSASVYMFKMATDTRPWLDLTWSNVHKFGHHIILEIESYWKKYNIALLEWCLG